MLRYLNVTVASFWFVLSTLNIFTLTVCLLIPIQISAQSVYSQLWGQRGERWNQSGILKDFSKVGYGSCLVQIPIFPAKVNVMDLGAKGDGIADDTEPFRRAIEACPAGGAVWLPDGIYKLTDWLQFQGKSNFTLRGESREKTILFYPFGLQEVLPKSALTGHGTTTTAWSWAGGFLWFDSASEVGMENFTMKYPDKQYPGHFLERGYNGIHFRGAYNCWIRNIGFYNSDLGINLEGGTTHVSVLNIFFDGFKGRLNGAEGGHHGIQVSGKTTQRNLIHGCEFAPLGGFVHELTVDWNTSGNVFSDSKGVNMHLDHHKAPGPDGPYGNLWTDIDLGEGTAVWSNNALGSNLDDIYWNIRAKRNVVPPAANLKNISVGFPTNQPATLNLSGPWLEPLNATNLVPQNIYQAQVAFQVPIGIGKDPGKTFPAPEIQMVQKGHWVYRDNRVPRRMIDAHGRRQP